MMLLKSPGISLLLAGVVLLAVVRPILGWLPFIGGMLGGSAGLIGLLAIVGGGVLVVRSRPKIGR